MQVWYTGHPDGAVEEFVAFTNPVLMESTATANNAAGEEDDEEDAGMAQEMDELPQYRITKFTFYNREAQVLPFYRDHIENGQEILLSGYLKPITDGNPQIEGGVPVCDAGPVVGWWVAGFDGGDRHVIGVTTEVAYYYLNEPSDAYSPFMKEIDTKTFIAKCVIEHLMSTKDNMEEVEYEDLLTVLEERTTPEGVERINEDAVVKHADFLVSQVHLR